MTESHSDNNVTTGAYLCPWCGCENRFHDVQLPAARVVHVLSEKIGHSAQWCPPGVASGRYCECMEAEMRIDDLEQHLLKTLPPILARSGVAELTGGLISAQTMAEKDCRGVGPQEGRFKSGKKVFYLREPFVRWLVSEVKELDTCPN